MKIDTDVGPEKVTVIVEGEPLGTLDRQWYDEWADTIAGEPASCLETCLSEKVHEESTNEELQRRLEDNGLLSSTES